MPDLSSYLSQFRADNHSRRVYVSVMTGSVVLNASVSTTPTFPAYNLAITVNSGSASDVKPGMRVVVETSGGDYKGTLSVRFAGTISSSNIPVREFSAGTVNIVATDVLKVYDDFLIVDKLVANDETFAPDRETYVDQNVDNKPICVSGGWWAGWLTSAASIPLVGSSSYTVDPDSGGTITHAWTAPSGTLGSSTDADTTVTYAAAGKYRITHVATDASNSETETQYLRFRVHDANDPPLECLLGNLSADTNGGWSASFDAFENVGLSAIPDGAPVIIWADNYLNGSLASYGNAIPSRSHILIAGYLRRDVSRGDANLDEITFEVISPLARLGELPGFSKVMLSEASPDAWSEIKTLTVKRAIIQLARYYTNFTQIHDMIFATGFLDKTYPALYLQKSDPLGQMRELADGVDARVICDRVGRMEIQQRLEFLAIGSRAAVTTTLTIAEQDIIEYELTREHYRPVETFRARGFTAGSDPQPVFSRWPGSPGTGNQSQTVERLIVDGATDHYARTGRRGAWEDRVFQNASGVLRHAPELRLVLFGSYDVFDLYREWVALSLDSGSNLRGIDLSAFRWLVQSISIEHEGGTATTTLILRAETNGEPGVDDTPPDEDTTNVPPFDPDLELPPPVGTVPINPPGLVIPGGAGRMMKLHANRVREVTNNFDRSEALGGPNWTDYGAVTGMSGTVQRGITDPRYSSSGWVLTTTEIGYLSNHHSAAASYTVQKSSFVATPALYRAGDFDYIHTGDIGLFGVVTSTYTNGVYVTVTRDGSTWSTEVLVGAFEAAFETSAVKVSTQVAGRAWIVARQSGEFHIWRTDDYGANWTESTFIDAVPGMQGTIEAPYVPGGTPESYLFYSLGETLVREDLSDNSQTDLSLVYDAESYFTDFARAHWQISIPSNVPTKMMVCVNNPSYSKRGVYYTTDNTASPPTWVAVITPSAGNDYVRCAFTSDGVNAYLWGVDGVIAYTNLTAIDSRIGDSSETSEVIWIDA